MVKLYIVAEGNKINIELDSLDITLDEFKKIIEKNMNPGKVIPHNEQSVFIDKSKLEGDKKLSHYIKDTSKEVKVFVLRQSSNVLGNGAKAGTRPNKPDTPQNPYSPQQPKKNPYEGGQNQQFPNWGYPPQSPYAHPSGLGYGSPSQGLSQMPPMNNIISKEQIDLLLSNPQFIEQIVDLQSPGLGQQEKENRVNMYLECFKNLKNDPNLMNSLNNMAPELLKGGMPGFPQMPPQSPYGGYPPQYPMPPQHGFPPQQHFNPYFQQPYYGYPPQPYPMSPYGSPQQPQPHMSPSHYEAAYAQQLKALEEMGFTDKKENLEALIRTNGDINAALDYLRKDDNFKKN